MPHKSKLSRPAFSVSDFPCLKKPYWDRPAPKERGDPNVDLTFRAVGRALTQWEKLEQRLANLFLVVCECPNRSSHPVRRAYGAIENGTLRRSAIVEAAKVYFDGAWKIKTVQKSFVAMTDAVSFASKRRDDIAHGIVQHLRWRTDPDGSAEIKDYGAFLFPPFYNTGRTKASFIITPGDEIMPPDFHRSEFRFTSEDIVGIEKRFAELRTVIQTYTTYMARGKDGKIRFVTAVGGDETAP